VSDEKFFCFFSKFSLVAPQKIGGVQDICANSLIIPKNNGKFALQ
jgi:hypothetical protein